MELPIDFFAFNGDDDPLTLDDQVHVTGKLSGGIEYFFGFDIDWEEVFEVPEKVADCFENMFSGSGCSVEDLLPEAKVGFGAKGGAVAGMEMKGVSFLDYEKEIILGKTLPGELDPIKFGPLVFFPELEVRAVIEGAASGEFDINGSVDGFIGSEVSYSSEHGATFIPPDADFNATADTPSVALDAYAKVKIGPRLDVKLYGFVGPYVSIYAFAELNADQLKSPCYTLDAGMDGDMGFIIGTEIDVIGSVVLADWTENFPIWKETMASGDCSGGGSNAGEEFLYPEFTPWAMTHTNTVDKLPVTVPGGGIGSMDMDMTIDGRFVVAGSGNKGLIKIDTDGNLIWAKRYDGPKLNEPFIKELLPDHIANSQDAAMFVMAYPWALLKVEASGELIWAKQFQLDPNDDWWRLSDIEPDGSGGFFLTGSYGTNPSSPLEVNTLVARMDADGNIIWIKELGDQNKGEVARLIIPYEDGLIVTGTKCDIKNTLCSSWRLWAIRIDSSGNLIWAKEYPLTINGFENSVQPMTGLKTAEGDIILGGIVDGSPQMTLFTKIKPDGNLASNNEKTFITVQKKVSSLNLEDLAITSIVPLPTKEYIVTGTYMPYPYSLGTDIWVATLFSDGKIDNIVRINSPEKNPNAIPPEGSAEILPVIQYSDDGGALVCGYTEELADGGSGLLTMKVFAKDGQITFNPVSGITTESLTFEEVKTVSASTSFWNPSVKNAVVILDPIQVTVEDLNVSTEQKAP